MKPSGTTADPAAPIRRVVTPPPDTLTDAEEARAAELEAAIVAEERQAEADASRRRLRLSRGTAEPAATPRANSSLAAAASDEYAYVTRDVRRIAIVGGGLISILLVLWVIAQATGFRL
jgi:hypothetical protein